MAESPVPVWIVDGNETLRTALGVLIEGQPALRCAFQAGSGTALVHALKAKARPRIVLAAFRLPDMRGPEAVRRVRSHAPDADVIVLAGRADEAAVVDALCAGASGYLLRPVTGERVLAAIDTALDGGRPMSAPVLRTVLRVFRAHVRPRVDYGLTPREQEVLHLLAGDATLKEIADTLFVSPHTIDSHLRNIYAKLQVRSRSGAIVKALRERLL
jgi:DNA-binding NarL/FixJ family response regulator